MVAGSAMLSFFYFMKVMYLDGFPLWRLAGVRSPIPFWSLFIMIFFRGPVWTFGFTQARQSTITFCIVDTGRVTGFLTRSTYEVS